MSSQQCSLCSRQPILPPPDFFLGISPAKQSEPQRTTPRTTPGPVISPFPLRADSQPVLSLVQTYPGTDVRTYYERDSDNGSGGTSTPPGSGNDASTLSSPAAKTLTTLSGSYSIGVPLDRSTRMSAPPYGARTTMVVADENTPAIRSS